MADVLVTTEILEGQLNKYKEAMGLSTDEEVQLIVDVAIPLLTDSWNQEDIDDIEYVVDEMVKDGILESVPEDDYLLVL